MVIFARKSGYGVKPPSCKANTDKVSYTVELNDDIIYYRIFRKGFLYMDSLTNWKDLILELKKTTRNFLTNIVENINESIIVVSLNGIIIFFNNGSEKEFQYDAKDVLGRHVTILGVKKPNVLAEIRKGNIFRGEVLLKKKNGTQFPAFIVCIPLRNENGAPIAMIGLATDLTEEKRKEEEVNNLKKKLKELTLHHDFVSNNSKVIKIISLVDKIAAIDCNVLIQGESGTGKSLIAKIIHDKSPRNEAPFVVVDCAALSESLLESELFGYVKGAFTGANEDRKGYVEIAAKGTLLLDEISELPLRLQGKLLRVVQEHEITPVGSTKKVKINTRIIAATNKNLDTLVENGKFREDLFFRLNVVKTEIPPLRERNDDLLPLSLHFLKIFKKKYNKPNLTFGQEFIESINSYAWPGNIRELENTIQHAVITADDQHIKFMHLPQKIRNTISPTKECGYILSQVSELDFNVAKTKCLDNFTRTFITNALQRNQGNISKTAREINIKRASLQRIMRRYGIKKNSF
ncbi:MAG TPA: sigma 54-interacting transcriptional regulator [Desulfobacteraceae bacterium]|nr:sigma 54-interacting transcriptional regulator [Desulfobacteraceae bacterium]HPJ68921.1 sigma 54-interacting transcriptional regulator [Desulfobacteraceae bacterium]HPQ27895.1 sigma 54-interacting transcriptional regulator [Desulfobacteraceae bacterium]